MQKLKKRGIILFLIFILSLALVACFYFFFYKEPVHKGYFVLNEVEKEVSYGYLY